MKLTPHLQLLLLRRTRDSAFAVNPGAFVQLQHDVGRYGQGGRALEFLQGGAQNLQALLVPPARLRHHPRRHDHLRNVACTPRMARRWLSMGRHLPTRDRHWMPYPLPDRAQPVVDDLLVLSEQFPLSLRTLHLLHSGHY